MTQENSQHKPTTVGVTWQLCSKNNSLVLTIQSERIEAAFEHMANGRKVLAVDDRTIDTYPQFKSFRGKMAWDVQRKPALPSDKYRWGSFTDPVTMNGFNYRLLTLIGLSDGLDLPVLSPMSRSMGKEFVHNVDACCREFLQEYGKVLSLSGTIHVRDV